MIIDLLPLINSKVSLIEIDKVLEIPIEYFKDTDIRKIDNVKVKGTIDDMGDYIYNLKVLVSGTMTIPCALSLEDVEHSFSVNIDENIGNSEDFEKNYKIISNTLDILPILWENIVLEIPNKIVKDNVKIKKNGDGWCLTSEDDIKDNNQLSELKNLLDMEEKL